jgi:diguanylate cyclase (GGDEF)-like protein/PAS domain S-box-containing protein
MLQSSQEHFRALIQNSTDIITVVDTEGTILYQSPSMKRILGHEPEKRIGKNAMEAAGLLHSEDVSAKKEAFAKALHNPNTPVTVEVRMRHRDGSWRYLEETITSLLADPNVNGVVLNARCVTQRKKAEQELQESEERFRSVVERTTDGVFMADFDTDTVLESNAALQNMLGYTAEELSGTKLHDLVAKDRESIDQNMQRLKEEKSLFIGERRYRCKDGSLLDVEVSASVVPFKDGEASCYIIRDVTERKALEEQLKYQAFHDSLTGLANRTLFLNCLEHALDQSHQADGSVAVLLVDLDNFKIVNDSWGHEAGDTLLVEIARRLQASIRPVDTAARIFGDSFAILLEAPVGIEEAEQIMKRIEEYLQKPIEIYGQQVFATLSGGIVLSSGKEQPAEVLRHADLAMYSAKRGGKARYQVYDAHMDAWAQKRMDLESDLQRAIEAEEFETHYQPLIDLSTGKITGVEALMRWKHPERGLVRAEEFVEVAEETGAIVPIGRQTLVEACRQAKRWRERYPERELLMSVNFSARQFSHQTDVVSQVLSNIGLDPQSLQLEITERVVMDDAEHSIEQLKNLKDLGVGLSIDDYGMGYSCLYYLKHMPVSSLKIDQTFISGLGKDSGDEAIVSGTISLAHALGLRVIAEGVETEEQLARLQELRCDVAQGLYFSEPGPSETVERLFLEGDSK